MLELTDNVYNRYLGRPDRKLKIWRDAGLMLTYKCNCSCEFCYYNCNMQKDGLMSLETAMSSWMSLVDIAGGAARIHITGGEPFLYWDRLCEILDQAKKQKLKPAYFVETNGFWADDKAGQKLSELKKFDIGQLRISCDPFHQEYVEIEKVRKLCRMAEDILGPDRVLVRWRDYLEDDNFGKLSDMTKSQRLKAYVESVRKFPCMFNGRAAKAIADEMADKTVGQLAQQNCKKALLSAQGVHIDPFGNVFSGSCSGLIAGNVNDRPLAAIWREFDPANAEVFGVLYNAGPVGFLAEAEKLGYQQKAKYASKCHLCNDLRCFLFEKGRFKNIFGPKQILQ